MKLILESWRSYVVKETITDEGLISAIGAHYLNLIGSLSEYAPIEADKQPKIKKSTNASLQITNVGGRVMREKVLNVLAANPFPIDAENPNDPLQGVTIEPEMVPSKGLFRVNFNSPDPKSKEKPPEMKRLFFVELKEGATPLAKENLTIKSIQKFFEDIENDETPVDGAVFSETPQTFRIVSGDMENPRVLEEFTGVIPEVHSVPRTPKADFYIGSKDGNKIYISQKDGVSAKDFGQWSGLSKRAGKSIGDNPEVKNFGEIMKRILITDLKFPEYPSSMDFQMGVVSPDLKLKAIFGPEFSAKTMRSAGSVDNVDLVAQGNYDITVVPPNEPGDEKGYVILKPDHYILRRTLKNDIYDEKYDPALMIEDDKQPVLSTRRGDSGRSSFGITRARATLYPSGGRIVNFKIAEGSTPDNISFESTNQISARQRKAVEQFFLKALENIKSPLKGDETLQNAIVRSGSPMLVKLYKASGLQNS